MANASTTSTTSSVGDDLNDLNDLLSCLKFLSCLQFLSCHQLKSLSLLPWMLAPDFYVQNVTPALLVNAFARPDVESLILVDAITVSVADHAELARPDGAYHDVTEFVSCAKDSLAFSGDWRKESSIWKTV